MQNKIHEIVSQLSKEIDSNPETYFITTSELYHKDYKRIPCSKNEDIYELGFIMFWHTCSTIGEEKLHFLNQVQNDLLNHLNFHTAGRREDYLLNRLQELENKFSLNPLTEYLTFDDYTKMFSQRFMKFFYMTYMQTFILEKLDELEQKISSPRSKDYIDLFDHYFKMMYEMMAEYLKIILETKIITFLLHNKNKISEGENPYPLVFQNRDYYELFIFCMNHYQKEGNLKPALFSKYFMLFNYKGFLLSEVKDVTYKDFVKAEFGIVINRIRKERPIGSAYNEFENLRNNYFEVTGKKVF